MRPSSTGTSQFIPLESLLPGQAPELSLEFFRIDLMFKGLYAIYEDNRDVILVAFQGFGLLVDIDFTELELITASGRQDCRFGGLTKMAARPAVYDYGSALHREVNNKE